MYNMLYYDFSTILALFHKEGKNACFNGGHLEKKAFHIARFLGSYLGHPIYCNPAKMASVGINSFVLVYDPY